MSTAIFEFFYIFSFYSLDIIRNSLINDYSEKNSQEKNVLSMILNFITQICPDLYNLKL